MKQAIAKTLSLFSLARIFPDEASVVALFERVLWGEKPICPHCKSTDNFPRPTRRGHRCNECRKDFTVRTGTIFEQSRLPLRTWLFASYLITTARKGVSSLQLSKELEITQKTAWFLLHRLRDAAAPEIGELLSGIVEIDETFLGGKDSNRHEHKKHNVGGGTTGKTAILGMRERGDKGRVVAMNIPDVKGDTLKAEIAAQVATGSVVMTDEWRGYKGIAKQGYTHEAVKHSAKEFVSGMAHTNGIESVWAVLKRGFNGVYHNWSVKHTARYVNEFSFRLNEGNVRRDTIDRLESLIRAANGKRLTYAALTA